MNQPGSCCRLTPFVLAALIGASALAGCAPAATTPAGSGRTPGAVTTTSTMPATSTVPSSQTKTVELQGATSLTARIAMTLGALKLTGRAPADTAMSGEFSGNAGYPKIAYAVADGVGDLTLAELADHAVHPSAQPDAWTVALAGDVDSTLSLATGAGASAITLGDMNLKSLEATLGAGATTIDVTGPKITRLDAYIAAGSGALTVTVPAGKSVRIDVAGPGTGAVTATGLTKGPDGIYRTASSSGESADIAFRIDRGSGPVTLVAK